MIMNLEYIKLLCKELGQVEKFNVNNKFFGNIELEIITPNRTKLYIVSDRGEFLCYVKEAIFSSDNLIPINQIIKTIDEGVFGSLVELISYLKANLDIIEKRIRVQF